MARAFDEFDFKDMVKQILSEARGSAQTIVLHEDPNKHVADIIQILETGDEFGDAFGDVGWQDFAKVVGDPGKVKDAIVGSALKVGVKAKTIVSVIMRNLHTLVIPFVKSHYDEIYARERGELAKIKQKYPDVFRYASQIFTDDAKLIAFMINPVLMTAATAFKAPADVILGLVGALGASDNAISSQINKIWNKINRVSIPRQATSRSRGAENKGHQGNEDLYYEESVMIEASSPQKLIANLLGNKDFQKRLAQTRDVYMIKQDAENVKNGTLNDLLKFANQVKQIEDLETLRKTDPGIAKSIEQKVEKLEPGEAESVIQASIKELKNASLDALTKKMEADIELLRQLDIPEKSELIAAYEKTLSMIS